MSAPDPEPVPLAPETWAAMLSRTCQEVVGQKGQAWLCVTGKPGAGKSTLGRQLRKKGLPGIPARKIAVIDDGVLAVPLLGIFTRRIKSRSRERDNLAPFAHWVKKKRLVVYVNSRPERRLERCDVVLRLRLPEELREQRLEQRDHDGGARFRATVASSDQVGIPADHVFDLCLVTSHDRAPDESARTVTHTSAA